MRDLSHHRITGLVKLKNALLTMLAKCILDDRLTIRVQFSVLLGKLSRLLARLNFSPANIEELAVLHWSEVDRPDVHARSYHCHHLLEHGVKLIIGELAREQLGQLRLDGLGRLAQSVGVPLGAHVANTAPLGVLLPNEARVHLLKGVGAVLLVSEHQHRVIVTLDGHYRIETDWEALAAGWRVEVAVVVQPPDTTVFILLSKLVQADEELGSRLVDEQRIHRGLTCVLLGAERGLLAKLTDGLGDVRFIGGLVGADH